MLSTYSFYLFFLMILLPPRSTLFPYTTLFRSAGSLLTLMTCPFSKTRRSPRRSPGNRTARSPFADRKSTRLNSSHLGISYAVFCLKKKKNNQDDLQL